MVVNGEKWYYLAVKKLKIFLRGMLHIGEMKFIAWWIFFEIHVPFTSDWKLKISNQGWNGHFDLSAWYFKCFLFIKIKIFCYVIANKRSVISVIVSDVIA